MSRSELENFVQKFHQLRQAGFTAHLDVDTHAGQAWVGLHVMLGPGPIKHSQTKSPRHRSPSYLKRQERRKAARLAEEVTRKENDAQAERAQKDSTEEVCDISDHSNVNKNDDEEAAASAFKCEICDFETKKESGLRIHMSKNHAVIEQLDGNVEIEKSDAESEEYDIAKDPNYELRTYLSYASCDCCTHSPVSCGRKVSTAWITKGTPRWKTQILPFKPGYLLE